MTNIALLSFAARNVAPAPRSEPKTEEAAEAKLASSPVMIAMAPAPAPRPSKKPEQMAVHVAKKAQPSLGLDAAEREFQRVAAKYLADGMVRPHAVLTAIKDMVRHALPRMRGKGRKAFEAILADNHRIAKEEAVKLQLALAHKPPKPSHPPIVARQAPQRVFQPARRTEGPKIMEDVLPKLKQDVRQARFALELEGVVADNDEFRPFTDAELTEAKARFEGAEGALQAELDRRATAAERKRVAHTQRILAKAEAKEAAAKKDKKEGGGKGKKGGGKGKKR